MISFQWKQDTMTPVPKCIPVHPPYLCGSTNKNLQELECVVRNQIVLQFDKYDLTSAHQFHFGYSTQDVLLHVADKWLRAI